MATTKLIRFLDNDKKEWLIVCDHQGREMFKLEWNDDLILWMDDHEEAIKTGDNRSFIDYWQLRQHS